MTALKQLAQLLMDGDPEDVRRRVAEWSEEGQRVFDELAGKLEGDGGLTPEEAGIQAYGQLRAKYENGEKDGIN